MCDQQNTASTPIPAEVYSGPGPLDVLEARITLATRGAMDDATRAVERLREVLDRSPAPTPAEVAREAHLVADRIDRAVTVARTLESLGYDR